MIVLDVFVLVACLATSVFAVREFSKANWERCLVAYIVMLLALWYGVLMPV